MNTTITRMWHSGCRLMTSVAYLRFYAELNDFLPPERRQVTFRQSFSDHQTVKDLIEALGVPHTEVDLILVNGESVDFSHRPADGDRISVYPVFEALDISPLLQVRPEPLREPKFVLDIHLGRLAAYLRMLGFDTLYRNSFDDEELAEISADEHRILLTRDRGLLKRSRVTHGYLVRSDEPKQQAEEVLSRFDLYDSIKPFSRCLQCNEQLGRVEPDQVRDQIPEKVWRHCSEYSRCEGCGKVYWKGTHYKKMLRLIEQFTSAQ